MGEIPRITMAARVMLKMHPPGKRLQADWMSVVQGLSAPVGSSFWSTDQSHSSCQGSQHIVLPPCRMMDTMHVANLTFGVPNERMEKYWKEELRSTPQGVMWTSGGLQEVEDSVCAPPEKIVEEEEDLMSVPDEKHLEDTVKKAVTEELEVALADWLEWDTSEAGAELEELSGDVPLTAIPKLPFSYLEKDCGPSPTVSSEEVEEWDSDSSWDEDWDEEPDSNTQLWESFMCNNDPYNPFRCSSNTAVNDKRPKTPESCTHSQMSGRKAGVGRADEKLTVGNTKVRFSDVVKVHPLVTWSFASRAARDGSCWQRMALDRERFKRRVEVVGEVLSPCLETEHRARVWRRLQMV